MLARACLWPGVLPFALMLCGVRHPLQGQLQLEQCGTHEPLPGILDPAGGGELAHQEPLDPMQDIHFCLSVIIVKEMMAEEGNGWKGRECILKGDSVSHQLDVANIKYSS